MILVTGANGRLGRKVVETLLEKLPASRLAVSVRDPLKAAPLRERGVDVRHGNFDDDASLRTAFAGVERLLLISADGDTPTRIRQHRTAVSAAQAAGVRFIAYTSIVKADTTPLFLGDVHRDTEEAIRATGIPYAFLRHNWYVENELQRLQAAAQTGTLAVSAGNGRVGWAARGDYAEAAAAVLGGSGTTSTIYNVSGTPTTYRELAAIASPLLGRSIGVEDIDDAEFERRTAQAGLPAPVAKLVASIQTGIRHGALDIESDDLPRLLGRPQTPLAEALTKALTPPA